MALKPINQRLKFLLEKLGVSARAFSEMIGEKSSNTQNYVGARSSMPGADYLEKVLRHFEYINPIWLLMGEGEPFKDGTAPTQNQTNISGKKNSTNIAGTNNGTQNTYNLTDCEKERDGYRSQLETARREVELLSGQVEMQKGLIASQQQVLDLLRGGVSRPN